MTMADVELERGIKMTMKIRDVELGIKVGMQIRAAGGTIN
jgi:uncharacterized OB-fold protein